jgi:hypothetical protein
MAEHSNMNEYIVYTWLEKPALFIIPLEYRHRCKCHCTFKLSFSDSTEISSCYDVGSMMNEGWMRGLILIGIFFWIIEHLRDQYKFSVLHLYNCKFKIIPFINLHKYIATVSFFLTFCHFWFYKEGNEFSYLVSCLAAQRFPNMPVWRTNPVKINSVRKTLVSNGPTVRHKILGLLYKRALFDLQFVYNLFWLKLKWNARSKLFYCIIYRSSMLWRSSRTLIKLKSRSQKRFNERKYQYLKHKKKNHSGPDM